MKPNQKTGITRILHAFGYSLAGLRAAYQHEAAFRQEFWLAAALMPAAALIPGLSVVERLLLASSVILVLIVELLNSAIEAIVDRVSSERHPLSKRAKDIGSAAVFVSLLQVAVVWGSILLLR